MGRGVVDVPKGVKHVFPIFRRELVRRAHGASYGAGRLDDFGKVLDNELSVAAVHIESPINPMEILPRIEIEARVPNGRPQKLRVRLVGEMDYDRVLVSKESVQWNSDIHGEVSIVVH